MVLPSYISGLHHSPEPAHLLIRLPAVVPKVAFHRCPVPCTSLEDEEKLCGTTQSNLLVSCGPLPSPCIDSPLLVTVSVLVVGPSMRPGHAGSNYSRWPTMRCDQEELKRTRSVFQLRKSFTAPRSSNARHSQSDRFAPLRSDWNLPNWQYKNEWKDANVIGF
jgi:hypothetical protein